MERTPEQIETELLVIRAQLGEHDALRALFARWNGRLLAHATRVLGPHASLDASDAAQEAWLAIAKRITKLSDPALFAPWAHRIVTFKCADLSRKAVRERRARENKPAIESTEHAERADDLRSALERLSLEHRTVLSMRYGSELSVAQIAMAVGAPEGTVKSRLHAAREAIRQHMEHEDQRRSI